MLEKRGMDAPHTTLGGDSWRNQSSGGGSGRASSYRSNRTGDDKAADAASGTAHGGTYHPELSSNPLVQLP